MTRQIIQWLKHYSHLPSKDKLSNSLLNFASKNFHHLLVAVARLCTGELSNKWQANRSEYVTNNFFHFSFEHRLCFQCRVLAACACRNDLQALYHVLVVLAVALHIGLQGGDCKLLKEFLWQKANGMRTSHCLWFRTSPLRSKSVKNRTVPCLAGWWEPLGIIWFAKCLPTYWKHPAAWVHVIACVCVYFCSCTQMNPLPKTIYKEQKEMPGAWQMGKLRRKTGILMLSWTISGFRLLFAGQIHREGRVNRVQLDLIPLSMPWGNTVHGSMISSQHLPSVLIYLCRGFISS